MKAFCIPKEINKKILEQLDNGQLSINSLIDSDYDRLDDIIKGIVGDKYSAEIADRFVRRFKTQLSKEDTINIAKMFSEIEDLIKKEGYAKKEGEIMDWARKRVGLDKYMENIVNPDSGLSLPKSVEKFFKDEWKRIADQETLFNKILTGADSLINIVTSPIYKSIKASFDISYALRQGFKVLTKSPKRWWESVSKTWDVWKNIKDKKVMQSIMDEHRASLISKKNFQQLSDNGLAVGVIEDWFPTTIAEKIPQLGNIFKASNEAFTMFSQQARYSLADDMMTKQLAVNGGKALSKEQLKSITQLANSITGRGSLGRFEASSGWLNKLLFSARFIRSQADTFIMPFNQTLSKEVQREARIHSLTTLGAMGSLIATASIFGDVETDPRSSNFGKMKIGDKTWIDLTAGLGSYIALATKLATRQAKSAKTGKVSKLNTGKYGSQTTGDVLSQWFQNKLAPAPGALNTLFLRGRDFKGDVLTAESIVKSLGMPISLENLTELIQTEDGATIVAAWVADVLGMSSTTFK